MFDTLSSLKSATNVCGISSTQLSQCLYIRLSTIRPDASGKSGCLSFMASPTFTFLMNSTFLLSGEKTKPVIPSSTSVIFFIPLPSGFMIHICDVPLSLLMNATFFPPEIHCGLLSLALVTVNCFLSLPSVFITKSSGLVLFCLIST